MDSLTHQLASLSPAQRRLVEQWLRQKPAVPPTASATSTIPPRSPTDPCPLSFAQQRLWFFDQLFPASPVYIIPATLRLDGPIVFWALLRSLHLLIERHEALRTTFFQQDGTPFQCIAPHISIPLPLLDLQALPPAARQAMVEQLIAAARRQPFELSSGPLLRATLLRLADTEHVLLLSMHHIISDGWSIRICIRELVSLYQASTSGTVPALPLLPIQYADYALWQCRWLDSEQPAQQLAYWQQQLADLPTLSLPTDRVRPAVQTFRGASQTLHLSPTLTEQLKQLSRTAGATLFMTLLAALQLLLARISGQHDIVVGTPIAGRLWAEVEGLVGCFVNMLALRTRLGGLASFRELLARVREVTLEAYAHQQVPFEQLLEQLELQRTLRQSPLFQVLLNMINLAPAPIELPGLQVQPLRSEEREWAKFDLTLYVRERGSELEFELVYNADLFAAARMQELLAQLEQLLAQVVADAEQPLSHYRLLTAAMRARLPDPYAPLAMRWEGHVLERLSRQAQQTPDRLALVDASGSWSYRELERRSNQLAHYLRAMGIERQQVVAISAQRSSLLVWALLGVWKAGAAVLILDPAEPVARRQLYLELAQPQGWIDCGACAPQSPSEETDRVSGSFLWRLKLSEAIRILESYGQQAPALLPGADDVAYVIFTSGTSGVPKAIVGTHRPVSHFLHWHSQTFGLAEGDRFSLLAGLGHDPLLRDILTPLWVGATLCIPSPEQRLDSQQLLGWMADQAISIAHLTPALGQLLSMDAGAGERAAPLLPALRYSFFGGDELRRQEVEQLRELAPQVRCVNFYGTTETPQAIAYALVPEQEQERAGVGSGAEVLPVGRGIEGVQLLVLNAAQHLAGLGEVGEIYVRTPYLSRGYLNLPDLTAEKFVPNPFADQRPTTNDDKETRRQGDKEKRQSPDRGETQHSTLNTQNSRLYRTGDRARYLPDGTIEYLGRLDQQVKLRGFRIELGEIEAVLMQHQAVQNAIAMAREDVPGNKRLVVYVIPAPNHQPPTAEDRQGDQETRRQADSEQAIRNTQYPVRTLLNEMDDKQLASELRVFLEERLPTYMVPVALVILEALPLTPNGKVNRQALPIPTYDATNKPTAFVAPRTAVEHTLASIWQNVLDVPRVGVRDNFFTLGGDSLLTVRVAARTKQAGLPVTVQQLLRYQTIAELASILNNGIAVEARTKQDGAIDPLALPPGAIDHSSDAEDSIHLPMTAVVFIPLYSNESWKIQEVYFEGPVTLNPEIVKQSVRYVHEFHEALRLRYVRDDRAGFWPSGLESGWTLRFASPDSCDPFLYVDLSDLNSDDQDRRIEEIAVMQRNILNVVEGPVVLLIYFNLGLGKPTRLRLFYHHSVMDGYALSIVLEDIYTVYHQIIQGQAIHITKTTSYSVWAEQMHRYMTSERMRSDVIFWSSLPWAKIGGLPQDYTEETITNTSILSVLASFGTDETNDLLHKAPSFYNMELVDILVAALVLVLARWSRLELIIIAVLSHGRDMLDDIDISRTVGCMSISNREMLHIDTSIDLIDTLYSIKEQRRSMPSRGKLEGWTRNMCWREIPNNRPHAQLNYLGVIYTERKDDRDLWRRIPFISRGEDKETRFTPWTTLDCRAYIHNGMFVIQWQYSELLYKRSTIEGLAEQYVSILRSIIAALAAHRQP